MYNTFNQFTNSKTVITIIQPKIIYIFKILKCNVNEAMKKSEPDSGC